MYGVLGLKINRKMEGTILSDHQLSLQVFEHWSRILHRPQPGSLELPTWLRSTIKDLFPSFLAFQPPATLESMARRGRG